MKKTLSIILAILMIVTTVPFAFAAEENVIDLSMLTEIYVISDSGEYTFTGSGSYGIKVESGNPTIVLNNASITVGEGSAIDIASGSTTTIFVMGDNTIDTDSMWETAGGIFVAEGGTVNITSNGTDNILRAHGTLAAAIGGKYDYDNNESYNAGSISISNVTVYAYTNNFHAAAIGAAGEGTCGTINITNAVVYAYGAGDRWTSAPGIGSAWSLVSWSETIPVVIISDSEVHTFRHNSGSDYIGYLGDVEIPMNATGSINCGEGGSITNSTIYCYTGLDSTTTDKTVKYGTLGGLLKEDGTCEDNCEGGSATCSVLAICENCGTSYGEFDANNHTLAQKDAKAPTCTEIGWDAYEYCAACDYTTYVELPAITHIDANCDYKCDYNCGYVYETLDFSDAKILTVNDANILCIDGVEVNYNVISGIVVYQYIPAGKYKLASDISILHYNTLFHTDAGSDVEIDLNGYTWSSKKFVLYVQGSLSIYDTSAENTGKIISTNENGGILTYNGAREINLYNGTLENIDISVHRDNCVVNLYGGKIKCDTNALICHMEYSSIINIYDTVLETSDGVAHIDAYLYDTDTAHTVINVAGYSGEGLTIDAWIDITGKFKLLEGIENAEEAEKYTVNYCSEFGNCFLEKTEYDETTGELYVYVVANAFTQQPSAENDYTVDFNNTNATFKWYEVEETVLTPDNVTAIDEVIFENEKWLHGGWYVELFTVDVEAGDMITVSTTSARSFDLNVFTEDYSIDEYVRATGKASVTIDSDAEVIVGIDVDVPNETTEFEIELIRTSELDETETDKTLQNPECGKTYVCKATVGENDYLSDVVTVGHNIVSVDAKAPTCTEIGWDAYEYCTACTYTTYVELPADPDAHTPLEAVKENEVAPKCDVAGSYDLVVYCDDCGAELDRDTKTVDALKHSFTKYEVTEEAKCGVEGKEVATCDNGCGATDEKAIDALRHSFTKYEVTEEAKCGVAGKEVATCDNGCGATDEKAIEALTHKDADGDYKCDNGCGHEFEKPVTPDEPTPDTPDEPTDNACDHLCHKTGILGFFWKIVKFFSKLFKLNPVCECGAAHY